MTIPLHRQLAIEWTDATFNPWWGCQKISPACDHCYAERDAHRFAPGRVLWGAGSERRTFGDAHWAAPLNWAARPFFECPDCGLRGESRAMGDEPRGDCKHASARPARRRVFCASMADWLDLDAPLDEFVRLLDTIRRTPELDWLLLSKRIGNWRKRMDEAHARIVETEGSDSELAQWTEQWLGGAPPQHVWLGSTVVTQEEADRDVPKLLAVPARVRFLSVEPMLGPIDLRPFLAPVCDSGSAPGPGGYGGVTCSRCDGLRTKGGCPGLEWVICGGESGPHARPMHPDWARSLRDQCAAAGVPFLFKQWGEWGPDWEGAEACSACGRTKFDAINSHGECGHCGIEAWDAATKPLDTLRRVGKKAAGRLLDGRTHDDFPLTKLQAAEKEAREPSLFPPT